MTTQTATTRDRRRMHVRPSEIRPGDLMRDLGRLREVEHVEAPDGEITQTTLLLVHFADGPSEIGSLGVTAEVQITVWRKAVC